MFECLEEQKLLEEKYINVLTSLESYYPLPKPPPSPKGTPKAKKVLKPLVDATVVPLKEPKAVSIKVSYDREAGDIIEELNQKFRRKGRRIQAVSIPRRVVAFS